MRYAFCCLQLMDDIIDGDRPISVDPFPFFQELERFIRQGKLETEFLQSTQLLQLSSVSPELLDTLTVTRAFLYEIEKTASSEDVRREAKTEVADLISNMLFDRIRSKEVRLLSEAELVEHHRATFRTSFNIVLIGMGSTLRIKDIPELQDALAWCSSTRDIHEDLPRGIVNIPLENLPLDWITQSKPLTAVQIEKLLGNPSVQQWLNNYHSRALQWLSLSQTKIQALRGQSGTQVFQVFLKAVQRYAVR